MQPQDDVSETEQQHVSLGAEQLDTPQFQIAARGAALSSDVSMSSHVFVSAAMPVTLAAPVSEEQRVNAATLLPEAERVWNRAKKWQAAGSDAYLLEWAARQGGVEKNRMFEVVGLRAAIGEQLGLALAAATEAALWREAASADHKPDAAKHMGWRALAETQTYFVLGAAHSLLGLLIRVLALDEQRLFELRMRFKEATFDPLQGDNRADWPTFAERTVDKLNHVACTSGRSELKDLVAPLVRMVKSAEWKKMDERRGQDFHRWRPQSAGVAAGGVISPWGTTADGSERFDWGVSAAPPDIHELPAVVSDIASNAMCILVDAMEEIDRHLPAAGVQLS